MHDLCLSRSSLGDRHLTWLRLVVQASHLQSVRVLAPAASCISHVQHLLPSPSAEVVITGLGRGAGAGIRQASVCTCGNTERGTLTRPGRCLCVFFAPSCRVRRCLPNRCCPGGHDTESEVFLSPERGQRGLLTWLAEASQRGRSRSRTTAMQHQSDQSTPQNNRLLGTLCACVWAWV